MKLVSHRSAVMVLVPAGFNAGLSGHPQRDEGAVTGHAVRLAAQGGLNVAQLH